MFRALTAQLLSWIARRQAYPCSVSVNADAHGITVSRILRNQTTVDTTLPWTHVESIGVLRRDIYARDLICMLIRTTEGHMIEFDESASGWETLLDALADRLHPIVPREQWFVGLMAKPPGSAAITIYERLAKTASH